MWLCLNTARRHRHSIESDEFRFDSHPIRGRIDRLAEIQSKSDRLLGKKCQYRKPPSPIKRSNSTTIPNALHLFDFLGTVAIPIDPSIHPAIKATMTSVMSPPNDQATPAQVNEAANASAIGRASRNADGRSGA
jgi:hypothetical protein